jgi:hypothetical protein
MTISVLRYISGEEQIGDIVVSDDGLTAYLSNPCVIETQIGDKGKVSCKLWPAALFNKDRTVLLNVSSLMYQGEPSVEILEVYNKRFSLIATPAEKKIIVG